MRILKVKTEKRKLGNIGERIARRFLKRSGYKILEKNYVAKDSEIDVIAKKGDVCAFVEVKTRTKSSITNIEPRPASAVTPDKQSKIIKAASHYKNRNPGSYRMRFDVIEVIIDVDERGKKLITVNHLENTFDANTAAKGYKRKDYI